MEDKNIKKILKKIFKEEIEVAIQDEQQKLIDKANAFNKYIKNEKVLYGLIDEIHCKYPDALIVNCKKNKIGIEKIAIVKDDSIYLLDVYHRILAGASRLHWNINKDSFGDLCIGIIDIQVQDVDCGDGSILLEGIIKMAIAMKATKITGSLSSIDEDHKDRRNHFYEKHCFTVGKSYIELKLSDYDSALSSFMTPQPKVV